MFPGNPNFQGSKEFQIEKAEISPGFNVFSKKNQGIPEFYGDDIALLKLTQKVKMSTHARCRNLGWEGTLYRGGCPGEPWRRGHQGCASVTLVLLLRPICLPCTVGANLALQCFELQLGSLKECLSHHQGVGDKGKISLMSAYYDY